MLFFYSDVVFSDVSGQVADGSNNCLLPATSCYLYFLDEGAES